MRHLMEVVDELGEVLNGVDVVVRRRGDQGHSRLAAPQVGDVGAHLLGRQLPTLTCATKSIQGLSAPPYLSIPSLHILAVMHMHITGMGMSRDAPGKGSHGRGSCRE